MPPSHRADQDHATGRFGSASRATLTLALLLPSAGCCSLARLLCGPDRSVWISIDYTTSASALATFMEALRRDRPDVLYEALSDGFRHAHGIPGKAEMAVIWEKLQEDISGLHMIGYADVSEPIRHPATPSRVRYLLRVARHVIAVELVQVAYWTIAYDYDGERRDHGRYAPLAAVLRVAQGEQTSLRLALDDLPLAIDEGSLIAVQAGREWKVDRIEPVARAQPDIDAFDVDAGGP